MKSPALLVLLTSFLPAVDWPQWRGPTRDGRIHEGAEKWPDSLDKNKLELV